MKKRYKALGYLSYVICFFVLVVFGSYMNQYSKTTALRDFNNIRMLMYISVFNILPIIIGVVIGLPIFISSFRKKGKWTINWLRLLIVGLPSLFFATFYLFYYFIPLGNIINYLPYRKYIMQSVVSNAWGIMFGFTVITSFFKEDKSNFNGN